MIIIDEKEITIEDQAYLFYVILGKKESLKSLKRARRESQENASRASITRNDHWFNDSWDKVHRFNTLIDIIEGYA